MKNRDLRMMIIIILIACNMRAPFTGVGALTALIRDDLLLSNALLGMLTTIPMLVFALISAVAPVVSKKAGVGRAIQFSLVFILAGELIRSYTGTAGLFIGTALLCIGIGIENVLLISVIKLWFPYNPATPTSAYSTTMAVTAAVAIGCSVFMARDLGLGWRGSLAVWGVFAVIAVIIWSSVAGKEEMRPTAGNSTGNLLVPLLKSWRMWILALFFGTQSMVFYCMNAWGPTMMQAKGFTIDQSSAAATFLQVVSLPITLVTPFLAKKFTAKRMMFVLGTCYIVGGIMFCMSTGYAMVYISLLLYAQGMGSTFSFCLLFFAQMGRDPHETAAISGLAQSGGYVLAAVGPVLMGALADMSGNWYGSMIFLIAMLFVTVITGIVSSKEGTLLS